MNKKLKVGIIGCGGIANSKHMPGLKSVEEAEMVAATWKSKEPKRQRPNTARRTPRSIRIIRSF